MQTLTETLNRYNNADDALHEAMQLVERLELETTHILNRNTEPITVPISGDTVREIKTPGDLRDLAEGTVISIGGIEYMRTSYMYGPWVDFLGNKRSHNYVFRLMLDHVDECMIVHEGN